MKHLFFLFILNLSAGCGQTINCPADLVPAIAVFVVDNKSQSIQADKVQLAKDGEVFECQDSDSFYFCDPQENGVYLLTVELGTEKFEKTFTIKYEEDCGKPDPSYREVVTL